MKKTIAIIPARGGSKRIPRKNLKSFCGKPMLAWPIQAARAAQLFDAILVSTDDEEIAAIAKANGAECPFRRPAELSDDHTPLFPVIAHAIRWFEEHRGEVELVCNIFATAPFVEPAFLRDGLEVMQTHPDAEFALSVAAYSFPIFRSVKRNADGTVSMFWPEHELTRSQDLPQAWHEAGQFQWGRKDAFLTRRSAYSGRSYPVVLPQYVVRDIDTVEDWEVAERMFRARNAKD